MMSRKSLLCKVAIILSSLVQPVATFSHGASYRSCQSTAPGHIHAHPLNLHPGYVTVHTSSSVYWPGQLITVTVRSSRDFMGFLLQARSVGAGRSLVGGGALMRSNSPAPLVMGGCWIHTPPQTHTLHCLSDRDTVTHSDKQPKRNLSFVWKAPDTPIGDIRFHITVVQSYFVYWTGIESAVVRDGSRNFWRGQDGTLVERENTINEVEEEKVTSWAGPSVSDEPTTKAQDPYFTSINSTGPTRVGELLKHLRTQSVVNRPPLGINNSESRGVSEGSTLTSPPSPRDDTSTTSLDETAATTPVINWSFLIKSVSPIERPGAQESAEKHHMSGKTSSSDAQPMSTIPQFLSQTVNSLLFQAFSPTPPMSLGMPDLTSPSSTIDLFSPSDASREKAKSSTSVHTSPQSWSSFPIQKGVTPPQSPISHLDNPLFWTFKKPSESRTKAKSISSSEHGTDLDSSTSPWFYVFHTSSRLQSTGGRRSPPHEGSTPVSTSPSKSTVPLLYSSRSLRESKTFPFQSTSPPHNPTSLKHHSTSLPSSFFSMGVSSLSSGGDQPRPSMVSPVTKSISPHRTTNNSSPPNNFTSAPTSFLPTLATPTILKKRSTKIILSYTLTTPTEVHPNPVPHPNQRPNHGHEIRPDEPNVDPKPKRPAKPSQPPDKDGKHPDIVPRHTALELGILLGGSAGFGMVLVVVVRRLCRQACGWRTQVTLNDRDREYGRGEVGFIQVQECGDLVRVRKIRENSFVFLTEYDVLESPGN